MDVFLEEWRALIGVSLLALFIFVAISSRKAAQKRTSDRKIFFELSGFVQNQSRAEEIKFMLSRLIPHWPAIDTLTLIKKQSIELHDCRFTTINGKELCMVRFADQFSRPCGTATDVEMLRTVFIAPCDHTWPRFVIFFNMDLKLPTVLKKISDMADSATRLITQQKLMLGIVDPIDLQKISTEESSSAIRDVYTDNPTAIQAVLTFISSHQQALESCGTLALYCRDGWIAIESIYATPSNEPGAKYVINGKQMWQSLKLVINELLRNFV